MASKQGKAKAEAQYDDFDPKFEWEDNAGSFVLRIDLPGFKKEDFRVQVDSAGRLTVRGQRPAGDGKYTRFVKVFQLPPTSNLQEIAGRFEANALFLTVPKVPSPQQPLELRPGEKEEQEPERVKPAAEPKKEEVAAPQPPMAAGERPRDGELEKIRRLIEEEKARRAAEAAAAAAVAAEVERVRRLIEEEKARRAAAEAEVEKARRLIEEEKARRAAAAAAAAEEEKKRPSSWRERVAAELGEVGELPEWRWAEDVVETITRNREVIAIAAAAFSLGLIVSKKLFFRN